MQVILNNVSKRFGADWIVKDMNATFNDGEHIVILGPNGSGKSTLLKLISSFLIPTEGELSYHHQGKQVKPEELFSYISYASPYLELIEQMTVVELIDHHKKFKPLISGFDTEEVLETLQMDGHRHKFIHQLSSGMKMRLKLALAILSDTPLLLLDEPLSNIDRQGRDWYRSVAGKYLSNRLVIVCSNHVEDEYFFCNRQFELQLASNAGR